MIDNGLEYMRPLVAVGTFLRGAGPFARALNGARATPGAFTSSASFSPFPILHLLQSAMKSTALPLAALATLVPYVAAQAAAYAQCESISRSCLGLC
jgi:hypothetical protein